MRIYQHFPEAMSEIRRDLVEMGIRVHPKTYQDKYIADDPNFDTLEVQNYIYTVVHPKGEDLLPTQPWANGEFEERMELAPTCPVVNPGTAYLHRYEVWKDFLQPDGTFAYTYNERLRKHDQLIKVMERLVEDPDSRQLFVSIWDSSDVEKLGGISRVPCSLGYLFQVRKGRLNVTYLQRSADFATHFANDVYLAHLTQLFVLGYANTHGCDYTCGNFTHWIASLHMFKKDGAGVF
jgi:thymidylate synthase